MENRFCVLFDLDGTLLDTIDDLTDAVNAALDACACPRRTRAEVVSFVGNGIGQLLRRALPPTADDAQKARCAQTFYETYAAHCCDKTAPYPGIPAALAALRDEGLLLGVLSNKADIAVQLIIGAMFPDTFDIVAGEREGIPRKPEPQGVHALMHALGVTAAQTVYIGDSEVDVETARRAGVPLVACAWGFRGRERLLQAGADCIADTPAALLPAVRKLLGRA